MKGDLTRLKADLRVDSILLVATPDSLTRGRIAF